METAHFSGIGPSYVETGQVIDVDIEMYTVTVVTQYTQKPITGLAFATPYQHYNNGEGIYFMPEVGSLCWLCWPSDGSRPFVLGWAPAREDSGSLRANKMALNPGDIYLGTRDENFIILRRGGILQIGGGPLSQRIYMPVNNTIKDFCENYGLFSVAGDLEWTVDRSETTTDGKRPGRLSIKAREFADDLNPIAVLQIGSHKGSAQNILSLVIKESGAQGAATKISLEFRKDGSANWTYEKDVTWTVKDKLTVNVTKDMTFKSGQKARFEGVGAVDIESTTDNVNITGKRLVNIMGPTVNVGAQLNVGGTSGSGSSGLDSSILADGTFLTWLRSHKHSGGTIQGMTGTPEPIGLNTIRVLKLSQKLKAK